MFIIYLLLPSGKDITHSDTRPFFENLRRSSVWFSICIPKRCIVILCLPRNFLFDLPYALKDLQMEVIVRLHTETRGPGMSAASEKCRSDPGSIDRCGRAHTRFKSPFLHFGEEDMDISVGDR